tara:strand:- start:177 stop:479 length:303 start_codon:yes stop_codon:yes gene_type:complete
MKKLIVTRQGSQIVDMTPEEEALKLKEEQDYLASRPSEFDIAIGNLRDKRNRLLAETDFYALSDQTLSDDMTNYRQELRDITEGLTTVEDVEAVVFPTKP